MTLTLPKIAAADGGVPSIVDTETGELQERRLEHRAEAEKFYRDLAAQGMKVRVGMEGEWARASTLGVGTKSVMSGYGGDSRFGGSTSKVVSQVVRKATTATTLVSS